MGQVNIYNQIDKIFVAKPRGCASHEDCGPLLACVNAICINPCELVDFGPNSECNIANREAECSCRPGFIPADIGCKPGGKL